MYTKIEYRGRAYWRMTETGPRGGRRYWYLERSAGASEPDPWGIWVPTIREAGRSGRAMTGTWR